MKADKAEFSIVKSAKPSICGSSLISEMSVESRVMGTSQTPEQECQLII